MASCALSSLYTGINHRGGLFLTPYNLTPAITSMRSFVSSSRIHFGGSFSRRRNLWSGCCHATGPPEKPSPDNLRAQSPGLAANISRFQDTMQIFFAVLLWMSLFFWSSAWDGWNGRKRDNGSGFRK